MAARKRKTDESFEDYRNNLKVEERAMRRRLYGTKVYQSCDIVNTPTPGFISLTVTPHLDPVTKKMFSRGPCRSHMRMTRSESGKQVSYRDNSLTPSDRYYDKA